MILLIATFLEKEVYFPSIYLILPDSGDFRVISEEFLKGFDLAIRDEYKFSIIDEDPDTSIDFSVIYENIVNKHPKIVVGPILPKHQRISAEISMRKKVIQIIPITYDLYLGTYGNYVYPFNYKIYMSIESLLDYTFKKGDSNVVLLYENTTNGFSIKKFIDTKYDIPTIPIKNTKISKEYIAELIKDLKNYDALIFSDGGINSVNIYLSLRKNGYSKDVYVFDSWLSFDIFPMIIGLSENLYILSLKSISYASYLLKLDRKYKFIENYRKLYNSEPTIASQIGYDTGVLVKQALKSEDIKSFLLKYGILSGINGDYLISKNPEYIKIFKISGGGLEEVK
ncbi:MAG: ABC transporter substrate-binding protein [candidate division WOR-3 bacterium]|nr:ABC transporter substrate-binding protein [candidate division WOR-3 bacterium]MCX7947547.1 ABC transporter substrate-binding protein [candidate division WOR-3 bacterium]MDW8150433.1 ABC transporter substrate-binding protein [candidate division WOR-3 bacterium]